MRKRESMKARKFDCPYCGGVIDANVKEREFIFCNYCGQRIQLDDEKKQFTYNKNVNISKYTHTRYTDDAEVIRAQREADEGNRNFKQFLILWGFLILIPIGIFVGLFLNKTIARNAGKISAGDYRDLLGKDYETVEAYFESAGFINIKLIDLDDSGLMVWKNGKVETISVGGNTSFESTDWFEPDAKVVISYH